MSERPGSFYVDHNTPGYIRVSSLNFFHEHVCLSSRLVPTVQCDYLLIVASCEREVIPEKSPPKESRLAFSPSCLYTGLDQLSKHLL